MKKLSLLIGTLGGGLAGYLFSNKKLRQQLSDADDAEEAAKLLGAHLQKDGKKLAKQIQDFMESEEVQKNISKAKTFAQQKVDDAKSELGDAVTTGKKKATKVVKKAAKSSKKAVKKTAKRVKTKVRKLK